MLPDTVQIRKAARTVLKENYLGALSVSFGTLSTFFFGWLFVSLFSFYADLFWSYILLFVYTYFVSMPIFFGAIRYFSVLIEGKSVKPIEMFYYFSSSKNYKRVMLFISSIFFIVVFSMIAAMFLPTLLFAFSNENIYKMLHISMPIWVPILKTASVFLEILAVCLVILINIKYYLSVYFFVSNDYISVKRALELSIIVSKRTRADFWLLIFSMTGYILLSLPVFPLFFILPYFMLCYVIHSKCSAVQYNERIDFANRQYTVVAK